MENGTKTGSGNWTGLQLVVASKHLQYKLQKDDNPGTRIILHFKDNLKLVDCLLYRKWVYKNEITYLQFCTPL